MHWIEWTQGASCYLCLGILFFLNQRIPKSDHHKLLVLCNNEYSGQNFEINYLEVINLKRDTQRTVYARLAAKTPRDFFVVVK